MKMSVNIIFQTDLNTVMVYQISDCNLDSKLVRVIVKVFDKIKCMLAEKPYLVDLRRKYTVLDLNDALV